MGPRVCEVHLAPCAALRTLWRKLYAKDLEAVDLVAPPDGFAADDTHIVAMMPALRDRMRVNRAELAAAHLQRQARADIEIRPGMISLVSHGRDVIFVRWTYIGPGTRDGRQISLDSLHRIKTIVAYKVPVLHLAAETILIPCTDAVMVQTTASGRPLMPAWCVRMWRMYQLLEYAGPLAANWDNSSEDPAEPSCILCSAGLAHGRRVRDELDEDLYGCPTCLSSWHVYCAQQMSSDAAVPQRGCKFICPMCKTAEEWDH